MPLAIIAGLVFLALEVSALAWLFHWLFTGTASYMVVSSVIVLAIGATLVVWACVGLANRADAELVGYMAANDGAEVARNHSARTGAVGKLPHPSGSSMPSAAHRTLDLDLTPAKPTAKYGI